MNSNSSSVSRVRILMEVNGIGDFNCEFIRHLSPLTIATILRKLPISGMLHTRGAHMKYIETGLDVGAEKQRAFFVKGDVTYMTSNGSICIILQSTSGIIMNPIGKFLGDIESFTSAPPGTILTINSKR
jgi:uncharacterized protein